MLTRPAICRLSEELPRSSLSPAGGHPSASPHCAADTPSPPQAQPKPLRVRAVTFNMNFKTPTQLPEQLLGRAGCPEGLTKYDIVVVGTQESGPIQVRCYTSSHAGTAPGAFVFGGQDWGCCRGFERSLSTQRKEQHLSPFMVFDLIVQLLNVIAVMQWFSMKQTKVLFSIMLPHRARQSSSHNGAQCIAHQPACIFLLHWQKDCKFPCLTGIVLSKWYDAPSLPSH